MENNNKENNIVLQIKNQIDTLEKEIKHLKSVNLKIKSIRNLKISLRALQLAAPYVLIAGAFAIASAKLGFGYPFYNKDILTSDLQIMEEYDDLGNINRLEQYKPFSDDNNVIKHYTEWTKDAAGSYTRNVEVYDMNDEEFLKEDILELLDNEILDLKQIFGEPKNIMKETANYVSNEELEKGEYYQAVIYSSDKNDYITYEESTIDNIALTFIYLLVTGVASVFCWLIRDNVSSFNFMDCVDDIREKHKPIDIKTLRKKLEIKQDNYDRLMR